MYLLLVKYVEMNEDPMIHQYDCYQSTLEITFGNYIPNFYPYVSTNWVNTFGTQIAPHYA